MSARAVGIDDSVTTCDCCGKSGLKFTVVMQMETGDIAHYGQVCASRNTGKTRPVINAEIKAEYDRRRQAAAAELKASQEYVALTAKLMQRPRTLLGPAAADFIRRESDAELAKRREIAAKHGIRPYEFA